MVVEQVKTAACHMARFNNRFEFWNPQSHKIILVLGERSSEREHLQLA